MRVLITGASGFAGRWLARACAEAGEEVLGISRSGAIPAGTGSGRAVDLRDAEALRRVLGDFRPEVIYHLAALSSVGESLKQPALTVKENVASAASMLEVLRTDAAAARTVWVSSCQVYGDAGSQPVPEDGPLAPANGYAVSKVTGELLAGVYADSFDLQILRARPFNHSGPGQKPNFILSSVAQQAAVGRREGASPVKIVTGNPEARRDFTDVRDVVRAYRLLAERAAAGVYNVSSGHSVSAAEQVQLAGKVIAPVEVELVVDPALVRDGELMDLRGENSRLREATGWEPQITIEQTMRDTIEWWESELS